MSSSVSSRSAWICALLLTSPLFAQGTEEAGAAPAEDYRLPILEYRSMINDAMQRYKDGEYDEAFPPLYQLARWGEKDCQWALGLMYFEGNGAPENVLEAYAWMKTAAESGIDEWQKTVKRLHKSLPAEHRDYVDQYADDYIRRYGMEASGVRCEKEGGGRRGVSSKRINCYRPVSLDQTMVHLTPPVEVPAR